MVLVAFVLMVVLLVLVNFITLSQLSSLENTLLNPITTTTTTATTTAITTATTAGIKTTRSEISNDLSRRSRHASMESGKIKGDNIPGSVKRSPDFENNQAVAPLSPLRGMKVLLYITTHMPAEHVTFLRQCWPLAMILSPQLLQLSDVLFFTTEPPPDDLLDDVFRGSSSLYPKQSVRVETYDNPGYQGGAILAIKKAIENNWFDGYDWVIRLNPDVLIRNETWLVETMSNKEVDGIFAVSFRFAIALTTRADHEC